jgi:hypothetical protein
MLAGVISKEPFLFLSFLVKISIARRDSSRTSRYHFNRQISRGELDVEQNEHDQSYRQLALHRMNFGYAFLTSPKLILQS